MITGSKSRAARRLLGWSYATVARRAGCSLHLVGRLEALDDDCKGYLLRTLSKVRTTHEEAGIESRPMVSRA